MLAVAPAMANDLYDNGPYNGTVDAWTINFGFAVSDSFTLPSNATLATGFNFVYWDANSSDLLTSVDWCVATAPLCVPLSGETWGAGGEGTIVNKLLGTNQFGYEIYEANISGISDRFGLTGWVTLDNACTTSGCSVSNPIYWDENSGVGCGGTGGAGGVACPSFAMENTVGSIPSEAFTITGPGGATTPEPSSILLFGSGIVGLAGVLRRRLNR
jgi:hypothetical protein